MYVCMYVRVCSTRKIFRRIVAHWEGQLVSQPHTFNIRLMVQKSQRHLGYIKPVNNGINYQPQLVFSPDFGRTINSISLSKIQRSLVAISILKEKISSFLRVSGLKICMNIIEYIYIFTNEDPPVRLERSWSFFDFPKKFPNFKEIPIRNGPLPYLPPSKKKNVTPNRISIYIAI